MGPMTSRDLVREANDALNERINALFNEEVDDAGRSVRMSETRALYVGLPFDVDEAHLYTTSIIEDVESEHGRSENAGGTYAEWDIAQFEPEGLRSNEPIPPGSWRWPERV